MDIKTLESFKMSDAIKFHDTLNPKLWIGQRLRPDVKKQLLIIAEDFMEELGVSNLDVKDITISGSNAAFSYTSHSDLDLHIIIDLSKFENNEVYQELFTAKKNIYNDNHDITIRGVPVELYVQDSNEPVISLGEYSVLSDKWLKLPVKRRANLDQISTKSKYNKLYQLIVRTLESEDVDKVNKVLKKIRNYRQAGLDKAGEFGPENLAYKMVRSQGYITKLYALRDKLHSKSLSVENMYATENNVLSKPTPTISDLVNKHKVSREHILDQLFKGIQVELEHTKDEQIAREIALDHLAEDPGYYTKLIGANLEEASGYIPSEKEKNDPRFKTALTVDVKPDSIKKNAKAFNMYTSRAGIPPTANPNGKF